MKTLIGLCACICLLPCSAQAGLLFGDRVTVHNYGAGGAPGSYSYGYGGGSYSYGGSYGSGYTRSYSYAPRYRNYGYRTYRTYAAPQYYAAPVQGFLPYDERLGAVPCPPVQVQYAPPVAAFVAAPIAAPVAAPVAAPAPAAVTAETPPAQDPCPPATTTATTTTTYSQPVVTYSQRVYSSPVYSSPAYSYSSPSYSAGYSTGYSRSSSGPGSVGEVYSDDPGTPYRSRVKHKERHHGNRHKITHKESSRD